MSFRIAGIGEVLWDLLPNGAQLGGAPGNFAFQARQLGAAAKMISRVGKDEFGERALRRFAEMDLDSHAVQVDEKRPTGTAGVILEKNGTPRFTITEGVAWDALAVTEEALGVVRDADAVCFGTLAQRTSGGAAAIQELVAATPVGSLRVFDINLRQRFYSREVVERSLDAANVVKLNDDELEMLSPMLGLSGDTKQRIELLARQFDLRVVALTRGERGSLLYRGGEWSDVAGEKIEVVDTVGAGDAFTAAMVMGLLTRLELQEIHRIATEVASFVCSQPGATPELPGRLRGVFIRH